MPATGRPGFFALRFDVQMAAPRVNEVTPRFESKNPRDALANYDLFHTSSVAACADGFSRLVLAVAAALVTLVGRRGSTPTDVFAVRKRMTEQKVRDVAGRPEISTTVTTAGTTRRASRAQSSRECSSASNRAESAGPTRIWSLVISLVISWASSHIVHDGRAVAMGRVIGDGAGTSTSSIWRRCPSTNAEA